MMSDDGWRRVLSSDGWWKMKAGHNRWWRRWLGGRRDDDDDFDDAWGDDDFDRDMTTSIGTIDYGCGMDYDNDKGYDGMNGT